MSGLHIKVWSSLRLYYVYRLYQAHGPRLAVGYACWRDLCPLLFLVRNNCGDNDYSIHPSRTHVTALSRIFSASCYLEALRQFNTVGAEIQEFSCFGHQ